VTDTTRKASRVSIVVSPGVLQSGHAFFSHRTFDLLEQRGQIKLANPTKVQQSYVLSLLYLNLGSNGRNPFCIMVPSHISNFM
jgi:hypothetical protein